MRILARLWPYVRPLWPALALAYLCMVVLALTSAALAFLSGPALGFMFSGSTAPILYRADGTLHTLWQYVPTLWLTALEQALEHRGLVLVPAILVGNSIIKGVAQSGQFTLLGRTSIRVQKAVRAKAYGALLNQTGAFFAKHRQGDLLSRLSHDCLAVEQALFYGLGSLLRDTLAVAALLGFCIASQPRLALWTLVLGPLVVGPLYAFARALKRISLRGQSAQGELSQLAHESLAGLDVVQACQQEEACRRRFDAAANRYVVAMQRSYAIRGVRTPIMEIVGSAAVAMLLYTLAHGVRRGELDAAETLSFITALMLLYDPIKKLGHVSDYLAAGAAALERLTALIDAVPTVVDRPGARTIPRAKGALAFEHVSFSYGRREVLHDVSLRIEPGQMVALVGHSGAGKSTLAQLTLRAWDVTAGAIRLDGHDIRDLTLHALRAQMSHVGQETFLFDATVAQNIAFGRPEARPDEVVRAAEAAYAMDFIDALPQGIHTPIGERGVYLSGGQRQRLAIARALLRDTPLLVLDEATSSLDPHSERLVRAGLDRLMAGRTSLVIAHRLATVQHADHIVVLHQGRVAEAGTHAALWARQGAYAQLHRVTPDARAHAIVP